ncbi:MAG: SDR family oxidoreductase [Phycisphaeraceae bacterium]|nr:SDR family oxidoreductase [Phycisphaeraceae bacterium]
MSQPEPPVALVTGGARRVGRAVALELGRAGWDVAITYRTSGEAAEEVVNELEAMGRQALAIEVDFNNPGPAAETVGEAIESTFGRLKALVNNASCFDPSPLADVDDATLDRNLNVNARSPLKLIQRLGGLLADGADPDEPATIGRIVNFIDIHVLGEPLAGYLAYNCSKAMLREITQTAAVELAPHVTVNAIAPGVVAWADHYTEEMKENYMERVPLGRPGTPDDAAATVKYLVCDAHYCTGQVIRLDGGRFLT